MRMLKNSTNIVEELNTRVSIDNVVTPFQMFAIKTYHFIKSTGLQAAEDFGLNRTNVKVVYFPN